MRNNLPGDDPKQLWQSQGTEHSIMTLEELREKARKYHSKTRRELFGNLAVGVIALTISVAGMLRAEVPALRVAFAFAAVWTLVGQYFLQRGMWPAMPAADAGASTGVEYYRRELNRRESLIGRALRWSFGPVTLAIGGQLLVLIGIAQQRGLGIRVVLPFSVATGIWIVVFFVRRLLEQRELRREVAELDRFERFS